MSWIISVAGEAFFALVASFAGTYLVSRHVSGERFTCWQALRVFPWTEALAISVTSQPLQRHLMRIEFAGYASGVTLLEYPAQMALSVILCALIIDACLFWGHVFQHRYLMCLHHVHHSLVADKNMSSMAGGLTASICDTLLMQSLVIIVPPLIISVHPHVHFLLSIFAGGLAVSLHSEKPNGRTDPIFVTADEHRMHHAHGTSARNFSMFFKFWDHLMGTYVDPHPFVFHRHERIMLSSANAKAG